MTSRPRLPLLGKMILWLLLHFLLLGTIAAGLAAWQFRSGLDALLRSPAGDRLRIRGEQVAAQLRTLPPSKWQPIIDSVNQQYSVKSAVMMPHETWGNLPLKNIPPIVEDRLRKGDIKPSPPQSRPNRGYDPDPPSRMLDFAIEDQPDQERPYPHRRPPPHHEPHGIEPPPQAFRPVQPLFLVSHQNQYWVAVNLPLDPQKRPDHVTWLIHSENFSGNGLFFDFQPLLLTAVAIILLSILFWIPFAFHLTRYVKKLHLATEQIASGEFRVDLGAKRRDELGSLGIAITGMAARIDQLLTGQKRFLGDVAHELCSPLARLRTGIGILEHRLPEAEKSRLSSIEEDAQELATLIEELLDFTRSSNAIRSTQLVALSLNAIIESSRNKEIPDHPIIINIPDPCDVLGEERLLKRAISNIFRNIHRHAGELASVTISAEINAQNVMLTISDDGPGIPHDEHERIFEPFYRIDQSRTRDTGGTGLGLAIVRSCLLACGATIRTDSQKTPGLHLVIVLKRP
jgi:two-component system, OmpR family, sensor histidine kinase CpxA